MKLADTEQKSASGAVVSNTATTRLSGSWLIVARAVWLALVIPSLGLFVVGLPVYYQQLQTACVDPVMCNVVGAQIAKILHALTTLGFSVSGYAAFFTIYFAIIASLWSVVGLLIFWRRSDDWFALLAAFVLVMFNITTASNLGYALALAYPVLALPLSLVSFLGQTSFFVFLLLFPNGRLVPRWMGLILLLVIIQAFFNNFPSLSSPFNENWPGLVYPLVSLVINGTIIFSQIYRYRRVSTPVQRQQTKWVVLGVTAQAGIFTAVFVIYLLIPSIGNQIFWGAVIVILATSSLLLIPLSIGFSILRYRLYEIDVLINRTLVYGSLTALLALLYFGLIVALQSLFQGLFNQNNTVAIVVSTIVIFVLFQPLRHRVQAIIDRRFYRRKYDAAKIVEAFSATLRQEVDLDQLREQLLSVVQETMQPAYVSLWLRPTQQNAHHKPWRAYPPDSSDGDEEG